MPRLSSSDDGDGDRPTILVGYTTTHAGADAVALGVRLAQAARGRLALTMVLPTRGPVVPLDTAYENVLREQATQWLAEAGERIPDDVPWTSAPVFADSASEGLSTQAEELGAAVLVVGAADGSRRGRVRLGSVTDALVHSATLSLALAPAGSATLRAPITRLTVGIGTRKGADEVLIRAARLASRTEVPVRLVSLVAFDLPAEVGPRLANLAGSAFAEEAEARLRELLPPGIPSTAVTVGGTSIGDAVRELDWEPGDLGMVGSSRLGRPHRLFLGSTAARMVRELPVPVVVIPRGSEGDRS